jgi:ubiquinone/menaquinone biosynthesis C-methylase UbiE
LKNSQFYYKEKLESLICPDSTWLDLGGGWHILPPWMRSSEIAERALIRRSSLAVGIDSSVVGVRKHRSLVNRAVAGVARVPFKSNTFNVVSANMVVEHLPDPSAALAEVHRILEPGGVFVFHTPNVRNYKFRIAGRIPQGVKNKLVRILEGRHKEDVFPTVYRLNTTEDITGLAEKCGFRVVDLELVNSTAATAMLGPLVIPELLLTKASESASSVQSRSNIIAVLQKKASLPS